MLEANNGRVDGALHGQQVYLFGIIGVFNVDLERCISKLGIGTDSVVPNAAVALVWRRAHDDGIEASRDASQGAATLGDKVIFRVDAYNIDIVARILNGRRHIVEDRFDCAAGKAAVDKQNLVTAAALGGSESLCERLYWTRVANSKDGGRDKEILCEAEKGREDNGHHKGHDDGGCEVAHQLVAEVFGHESPYLLDERHGCERAESPKTPAGRGVGDSFSDSTRLREDKCRCEVWGVEVFCRGRRMMSFILETARSGQFGVDGASKIQTAAQNGEESQ